MPGRLPAVSTRTIPSGDAKVRLPVAGTEEWAVNRDITVGLPMPLGA